jgi:hypothetical protein
MPPIDERLRLAAAVLIADLRERAENYRPDETPADVAATNESIGIGWKTVSHQQSWI